jgi:hypothetical protein
MYIVDTETGCNNKQQDQITSNTVPNPPLKNSPSSTVAPRLSQLNIHFEQSPDSASGNHQLQSNLNVDFEHSVNTTGIQPGNLKVVSRPSVTSSETAEQLLRLKAFSQHPQNSTTSFDTMQQSTNSQVVSRPTETSSDTAEQLIKLNVVSRQSENLSDILQHSNQFNHIAQNNTSFITGIPHDNFRHVFPFQYNTFTNQQNPKFVRASHTHINSNYQLPHHTTNIGHYSQQPLVPSHMSRQTSYFPVTSQPPIVPSHMPQQTSYFPVTSKPPLISSQTTQQTTKNDVIHNRSAD